MAIVTFASRRSSGWQGLGKAVALLALAAALWPAQSHAAQKGVVSELTWGISAADQDRTAAATQDLGATWVRLSIDWRAAEPTQGSYDGAVLAATDRAVELSRADGAQIVMLVSTSPSWASGSDNEWAPPRDPTDFARFLKDMVARYAGRVSAWEIWNEENSDMFWSTGPDPARYARLLEAAHGAVKAADPAAKVVFGGLAFNDYDFVEAAYAAVPNLGDYYDVMATHPYSMNRPPESIAYNADGRMTKDSFPAYREVLATMRAHGDQQPIWLTEFGWGSATQPADWGVGGEDVQADYLTRAYKFVEQDPEVQVAIWYELRNGFWANDDDSWIDQLGLTRTDFSPKPAYYAFKQYEPPGSGSAATSAPIQAASLVETTDQPMTAAAPTPPPASATPERRTRVTLTLRWRGLGSAVRGIASVGRRLEAIGRVIGARAGTVRLRLQRRVGRHGLRTVVSGTIALHGAGRFRAVLACPGLGHWRVAATYFGPTGTAGSAYRSRFVVTPFRAGSRATPRTAAEPQRPPRGH